MCCYGTNTYLEEMNPEQMSGDAEVTFAIDSLDLVEGTYKLDVAVHKRDGAPYDYHRLLYTFRVKSRTHDVGIYRPRHTWTFSSDRQIPSGRERRLLMATLSRAEVASLAAGWRRDGKSIVFTNGVFDLVHPGHLRYLRHARSLGDVLIVGINSDRSVRANKGPSRPITPEAERAEVLAAFECVDAVTMFDEDTPHDLVAAVQPDVLVKGADWAEDAIVGRDIVEARGGRVVRVPLEAGYSTTSIVERVRKLS